MTQMFQDMFFDKNGIKRRAIYLDNKSTLYFIQRAKKELPCFDLSPKYIFILSSIKYNISTSVGHDFMNIFLSGRCP